MNIIARLADDSFDDRATQATGQAFEFASVARPEIDKEIIAVRLIDSPDRASGTQCSYLTTR